MIRDAFMWSHVEPKAKRIGSVPNIRVSLWLAAISSHLQPLYSKKKLARLPSFRIIACSEWLFAEEKTTK